MKKATETTSLLNNGTDQSQVLSDDDEIFAETHGMEDAKKV